MGREVHDTGQSSPPDLARANAALRDEIARRARVEEAPRASEQKYRSLMETTNTGYLIVMGNGATFRFTLGETS